MKLDLHIPHFSLSVARIGFYLVCFFELLQLYHWRDLCFYPSSAIDLIGFSISIKEVLLPFLMFLQIMMMLGAFFRITSLLNYIVVLVVMHFCQVHYHFDYAMQNLAFIFLFAPTPRALSIDSWRFSTEKRENVNYLVPHWFVLLFFLGIELVYLDSLFFKFKSVAWLDGLSFWMPAAIPHFANGMLPDALEIKWLMMAFSHLVLFLEVAFPLILFKMFRLPIFALGIGLHLGIVSVFPIPFFGLGVAALYLVFIDWQALSARFFDRNNDRESLFKNLAAKESRVMTCVGFILCLCMAGSQLMRIFSDRIPGGSTLGMFARYNVPISLSMGLYRHPVYIDYHYNVQMPILRWIVDVDGLTRELPTYDEKGYPVYPQTTGRFWVHRNWRLRDDTSSIEALEKRWALHLYGWFKKEGISPRKVKVLYKDVRLELKMDFEQDDRLELEPWHYAGEVELIEDSGGRALRGNYSQEFLDIMHFQRRRMPHPHKGASKD